MLLISFLLPVLLIAKGGLFSLVLSKYLSDLQVKLLKNKTKIKLDTLCQTKILNYIMILQYFGQKQVINSYSETAIIWAEYCLKKTLLLVATGKCQILQSGLSLPLNIC